MNEFHKPMEENPRSCLQEADRLKEENGNTGEVYYVAEPPELGRVYHAYYLIDSSDNDALALNHSDNGFGKFPRLKVKEVKAMGFPVPKNVATTKLIDLIQSNW